MKLNMKEKKILYAYGCPSHHNTVTRLKWLTALTVDPEAKGQMLHLTRKLRQRQTKAGTTASITAYAWRWMSITGSSTACVC